MDSPSSHQLSNAPQLCSADSAQASLVARLVEITAQVSMGPLPVATIVELHRKLDALEQTAIPTLSPARAEHTPIQGTMSRNPRPTSLHAGSPAVSIQRRTASSAISTTASASVASRWNRSVSERSSATTRPTTADTRAVEELPALGKNKCRISEDAALQVWGTEAAGVAGAGDEPEWMFACGDESKTVLDKVTKLVAELKLRHEESRHIHELGLAQNQTITRKLEEARKETAHLKQEVQRSMTRLKEFESAISRLKNDVVTIETNLNRAIAEANAGAIGSNRDAGPQLANVTSIIDAWRRDCAEVAAALSSASIASRAFEAGIHAPNR